ncbi:MAG: hypothetical protein B6D58_03805 [candidate division Zixibacteria bacterium 4484_95]|nr:MAG: hypothetical protein B6D58_03805 [candidate division Zixibacteria bacterium 4484_95]
MRIDSLGLYTNKGLIKDKIQSQTVDKAKSVKVWKPTRLKPDPDRMDDIVPSALFSSAESNQIRKLFGNFDVSVLTKQYQKEISSRGPGKDILPGSFIDVVV